MRTGSSWSLREVSEARDATSKSLADLDMSRAELSSTQEELRGALGQIDVLRHEITAIKSLNCALEGQLQGTRADLDAGQSRLDRALVEIDRERTAATQARKSLDSMRAEKSAVEERYRGSHRFSSVLLSNAIKTDLD